jgi:hypothetical protein
MTRGHISDFAVTSAGTKISMTGYCDRQVAIP